MVHRFASASGKAHPSLANEIWGSLKVTLLLFGESLFRQIMEPHRNLPSIPLTFSDFPRTLKVTPNYGIVFLSPNHLCPWQKSFSAVLLGLRYFNISADHHFHHWYDRQRYSTFQRMFDSCAWTLAPDTCLWLDCVNSVPIWLVIWSFPLDSRCGHFFLCYLVYGQT